MKSKEKAKRKTIKKNTINYLMIKSDIMPYELPVYVTNDGIYDYIRKHEIKIENVEDKIYLICNTNDAVVWKMNIILFALNSRYDKVIKINDSYGLLLENVKEREPYKYRISHKINEYRMLSIIHPLDHLYIAYLYNKYSNILLYETNRSPISIRYPFKRTKYVYYDDLLHQQRKEKNEKGEIVEQYDKEYEGVKTYYIYREINNVYKFYESDKYMKLEKRYKKCPCLI